MLYNCNLLCYVKCSTSLLPFKAVAKTFYHIIVEFSQSFCAHLHPKLTTRLLVLHRNSQMTKYPIQYSRHKLPVHALSNCYTHLISPVWYNPVPCLPVLTEGGTGTHKPAVAQQPLTHVTWLQLVIDQQMRVLAKFLVWKKSVESCETVDAYICILTNIRT